MNLAYPRLTNRLTSLMSGSSEYKERQAHLPQEPELRVSDFGTGLGIIAVDVSTSPITVNSPRHRLGFLRWLNPIGNIDSVAVERGVIR